MKIILISIFVLLLSGCGAVSPTVVEYKISTKTVKKSFNESGCLNKTLKVSQAFSSNSLMSLPMKYMQGESKQFIYSQAQWAQSPNRALTSQIVDMLKDTQLFKSVQISKSISKSDLVLEIDIDDFMQYFNEDLNKSYVHVKMCLTLIDSKDNSVIATKIFSSKVDVKTLNAQGGVKAFNIALKNILIQSADWFKEICKSTSL